MSSHQTKSNITAHMIVQNEEQWVWYAIQSVIDYVREIHIYDTGSQDSTVKIIKSIRSKKIKLSEKGRVTPDELITLRNQQIKETSTEWFMLLDGDEIWPQISIKELIQTISKSNKLLKGVVLRTLLPLGDVFHIQPESAGKYSLFGKTGHFNMRAYRVSSSYKWKGTYPLEAYTDTKGTAIQNETQKLVLLKNPYWHMTHLQRSSLETHGKYKLEIGKFVHSVHPEVFYKTRPVYVLSPWISFSPYQRLKAQMRSPFIAIKRAIL